MSVLTALRNSRLYQRGAQIFKWHILPDVLFGPILLLVMAWAAAGLYTQARLPGLESGTALCPGNADTGILEVVSRDFSTRETCNPIRTRVVAGQRYTVTFDVVENWRDGSQPTTPEGLAAGDLRWGFGYLGLPFRRVVDANYLQPVFEIRPAGARRTPLRNAYIYPLALKRDGDGGDVYRGEFVAKHSGELYMFANDAALPFASQIAGKYNTRYFYEQSGGEKPNERGNRGTACMIIARSEIGGNIPIRAATPICKEAAVQAALWESFKNRVAQSSARGSPYLTQ